jgi:hypothetical protein
MESGERTLLKTFPNVEAAEVALTQLQANGIHCSIETNDAGGMLPFLQVPEGVRLFVPASQFEGTSRFLSRKDAVGSVVPPLPSTLGRGSTVDQFGLEERFGVCNRGPGGRSKSRVDASLFPRTPQS